MVMSSVVMVAVADNRLGLEAAIKYIFISGMGSLLLLLGIAALYSTFGTLTIAQIAQAFSTGERPLLALPAVIMFMIAFLIKSAVVPFHFWQPDFHTTAPTPVSGLLSSVIVKVGIYGIIRITTAFLTQEASLVQNILIVLGLIGVFFGGLAALRTWNAKRMLAYSTLGQVGFILVAIGWGSELALAAALIYIFNHAFIKAGLLMLTGVIASHNDKHSADLADLAGAGKGLKLLSVLYLVGGLALAGVPPFNGFISKVYLLRGGASVESWLPLGLMVAGGVLTLIYVSRTWQWIFQQPAPDDFKRGTHHHDSALAPGLLIAACVLLGLFAGPLVDLAETTAAQVYEPSTYACAVLTPMIEAGISLPQGSYTCADPAAEAAISTSDAYLSLVR
jgi:multicomponent Na+:H+ antiporter subunit D